MRTRVKIFIGLSMPALALAAVWLWCLRRPQRQSQVSGDNKECAAEKSCDGDEKGLLGAAVSDIDSDSTRIRSCSNDSEKLQSQRMPSKEDLFDKSSSDSPAESTSGEQKKAEVVASELETFQSDPGNFEGGNEETWEIEFPQALCGRLIGKKGKNVQKISQTYGAKIRLIPQKDTTESSQRIVSLTGTRKQLNSSLKALQEKFPSVPFTRLNGTTLNPYPAVDRIAQTVAHVVLPEQEMFGVYVINIVDAGHFYVQLYDQMQTVQVMLQQLDQQMYNCYNSQTQGVATAVLPHPVKTGMLCAALSHTGWWWRGQVVGLLMTPDEVEITWLDYGGKATVPTTMLRQLRFGFEFACHRIAKEKNCALHLSLFISIKYTIINTSLKLINT